MNPVLLAIAKKMGFETMETRNSDRLDFREVAVWQVRAALEAAFAAGRADAAKGEVPSTELPSQPCDVDPSDPPV